MTTSRYDELTYTEKILHQLGDFTAAGGIKVRWHKSTQGVEHWTLELERPGTQQRSKHVTWLALHGMSYGFGKSLHDAMKDALDTYRTAEDGLRLAMEALQILDAAARLSGPSGGGVP